MLASLTAALDGRRCGESRRRRAGSRPWSRRRSQRSRASRASSRPRPRVSPMPSAAGSPSRSRASWRAAQGFDAGRLHQEAVLIATRADVEEELKRLKAHIEAARELLAEPGAVGRKLDFLAQEFNREANTLTSKAGDPEIARARACHESRHRSNARAGAEHRMNSAGGREPGCRRGDMSERTEPNIERRGLLLVLSSPVGRGQDLARACAPRRRCGHQAFRLGDDAQRRARARSTASDYYFVDEARFNAMRDGGRAARMGARVRQLLRHAARADRERNRRGPRRSLRHRLAGHPAARRAHGRRPRARVHPAAFGAPRSKRA